MHLLFDLDGTLTDSSIGIGRCVNHALAELGRDSVPEHGPELTDRNCNKADLVMAALKVAGTRAAHAVMVGDRAEDVGAAREQSVRAVGVGWGYGSRAELTAAGPAYLAETVTDLVAWVQSAG